MLRIVVAILVIAASIGLMVWDGIRKELHEAFSGNWLRFDEEPTERERLELENEEFNWGHNVRNYMEE